MNDGLSRFDVFLSSEAQRINAARQDHLATLGLAISGRRVLEVGAGIGLHTAFFEERGCTVLSTDGSAVNLAEIKRRFPGRKTARLDLDHPGDIAGLGTFDLVYCYGTLYHLGDPDGALARIATVCNGQILLETIVVLGNYPELHRVSDPPSDNQGIHGLGCRPTRRWVMDALKRHFGHAYTSVSQPDHGDFEPDWSLTRGFGNMRAIFVGSKVPLSLLTLTEALPTKHAKCAS